MEAAYSDAIETTSNTTSKLSRKTGLEANRRVVIWVPLSDRTRIRQCRILPSCWAVSFSTRLGYRGQRLEIRVIQIRHVDVDGSRVVRRLWV